MIQKRKIKSSGFEVPALCFGCMRLPKTDTDINYDEAEKLLNYAIDKGINFFDVSYESFHSGNTEKLLSKIIKEHEDKIIISTKLPINRVNKEEDLYKLLNKQLEDLGVETIDFYLLHSIDPNVCERLENFNILGFLDKIKEEKKVKHVGFSYSGDKSYFKNIIDRYNWDVCMVQYNYTDDKNPVGTDCIAYASKKGVSVLAMKPYKGAMLTKNTPLEIEELLEKNDISDTNSRWALHWVLNNPNITSVICSMNTTEEIDENIEITNSSKYNVISESELDIYKKAKKIYEDKIVIQCTNCKHCLPCPLNVDIPTCFETLNKKNLYNLGIKEYVYKTGGFNKEPSYASLCIDCGACIPKCPQNIDIPSNLKKVQKEMEFPGFKHIMKMFEKFEI